MAAARRPEAKQVYEATLKLDPNNAVVLNNLAFLLAESGGDLDDALTKAQRAKQILPNLFEISDTLGWIYLKKNLADNAIDIFKDLVAKAAQPLHLPLPPGDGVLAEGRQDEGARAASRSAEVQSGQGREGQDPAVDHAFGISRAHLRRPACGASMSAARTCCP